MTAWVIVALVLFGLVLGSFAGATVWRLRAQQLKRDKKAGEPVDPKEWKRLQPLTKTSVGGDRSRCLHCGYTLQWYDLVPLLSWLSLKGRCRSCRQPIGWFEPLMELGVATFFVVSYLLWPMALDTPLAWVQFVVWLFAGVALAIQFAYDAKWFLLPDSVTIVLIGLGVVSVALTGFQTGEWLATIVNALGAVAVLSGLYFVLYIVSKGRWIGFGDVKLGIALGLLLGTWPLALLALFLANFIGCLVVIPFMLAKRLNRTSQVPFGPLLIVGMVITQLIGAGVISWYTQLLF